MNSVLQGLPAVDVALPDLTQWAPGNTGIPYVWRFGGGSAEPRVTVQALTHGNEVCGAIALDWLLRSGFRPGLGTLTLIFANAAAYQTFDASDPSRRAASTRTSTGSGMRRCWTARVAHGSFRVRASCVRATTPPTSCSICIR